MTLEDFAPKGLLDWLTKRLAAAGRHASNVRKRVVPYKHELTAIAKLLGCEDKPFQCWVKVQQLQEAVDRAREMASELSALRAEVREKTSEIATHDQALEDRAKAWIKAQDRWAAMGFNGKKPPVGADMYVWLISQLEVAEARLGTERAALEVFQASAIDLIAGNERLRGRVKALEAALAGLNEAKVDVAA